MSTTTISPGHKALLRNVQNASTRVSDPQARAALEQAITALHTDPTRDVDLDTERNIDAISELTRQLKPLERQAGLAHERDRLLADPNLDSAVRDHQINKLGKINPTAVDQLADVLAKLRTRALALVDQLSRVS